MRKKLLTVAGLLMNFMAIACPVCERTQPNILRGITHGSGPESKWDYLIVWSMVAVVVITLFYSVKWLLRPGEKADDHIKRDILNYN